MRAEHLVERVEHLGDAQILDVVDGADEVAPEIAQHLLPGDLVVGDAVELLLEIGGEVIFDIAAKKFSRNAMTTRPLSSPCRRFFSSRT